MAKTRKHKRSGRFIMKWEELMSSESYRALRPVDRCLLDEFQRIYRPGRNGHLSISTRRAAELLNVNEKTACTAFKRLEDHGFIKLSNHHLWQERRARTWYLTFEEGSNGQEPADDWRNWKKDKNIQYQNEGQTCANTGGRLPHSKGQSTITYLKGNKKSMG